MKKSFYPSKQIYHVRPFGERNSKQGDGMNNVVKVGGVKKSFVILIILAKS